MGASRKIIIILVVVGMGIFGYTQYASVSNINVAIIQSEIVQEDVSGSTYDVELLFENPSLLILTAGALEFFVIVDDKTVGVGHLESFVLPPLESSIVSGTFHASQELNADEIQGLKINGSAQYNVLFTSIEIPFVFYPTETQTREFIDGS